MKIIFLIASAALICLIFDKIYQKFWNKGLGVRISFQERPVLEGEKASLTEIIENRKLLPLTYLNVKFKISRNLRFDDMENTSVSDFLYKSDIFSILSHRRITRTLSFTCLKRGFYEITQADMISANLLMTNEFVNSCSLNTSLYVYPKYLNIDRLEIPLKKMIGTAASRHFLYEDPFEFCGLRDYTITDPMSSINWKASARAGGLMVNLHDSTASQEAVILLNLESESIWVYEQLHETAIRLAASVSYYFLKASIPARMVCNGCDCITKRTARIPSGNGIRQMNAISEALARIDLSLIPDSFAEKLNAELALASDSHPIYIMISHNMNKSIQRDFALLAKQGSACMWIAPLYDDMEMRVEPVEGIEAVRWEVNRYED